MAKYYDWEKTLSYDADVTMVVGARGLGKTFGLRKQFVRDFINHHWRFVEAVRYKNELSDVADGYFERVGEQPEFDGLVFKTDARYAYIAEKPDDDEERPKWWQFGYYVALSEGQKKKKKTFNNVRRILLDEAILEKDDIYHRYLPNEATKFANLISTVSRERKDTKSVTPRAYLLGNALDLANPYFALYGVGADLTFGYRWYADKEFLLHYPDPGEYAEEMATGTVAGRMLARTQGGKTAMANVFRRGNHEFVMRKTKNAKFSFGIVYLHDTFGVWLDQKLGYYFVTRKIPRNTGKNVYYLTRDDASVNYVAAMGFSDMTRYIREMYSYNLFRYEDEEVQSKFGDVLRVFGVR